MVVRYILCVREREKGGQKLCLQSYVCGHKNIPTWVCQHFEMLILKLHARMLRPCRLGSGGLSRVERLCLPCEEEIFPAGAGCVTRCMSMHSKGEKKACLAKPAKDFVAS